MPSTGHVVDHAVLTDRALTTVNVAFENVDKHRAQVNRLRVRLEAYIAAHPRLRPGEASAIGKAVNRRRSERSDADVEGGHHGHN